MLKNQFDSNSVWWVNTSALYILILVYLTLTLIQGHRCVRKEKKSALIISQSFQSIWIESGLLSSLVSVANLMFILFRSFNILGREPDLRDLIKNNINIGLYSDIYGPISFKLGLIVRSTFIYQFWWPLPSSKVTVVWETKLRCSFSRKCRCRVGWKSVCFQNL